MKIKPHPRNFGEHQYFGPYDVIGGTARLVLTPEMDGYLETTLTVNGTVQIERLCFQKEEITKLIADVKALSVNS